jgi:uncharacterized protein involved in outer membrane biogenesis
MVTTRRAGRWALYALGGVVAVVVLARVGLGLYLSSAAGKAMVARKIGHQIGMPVEVTQVRVGMVTSSVGLKVFDPAAPEPSKAEVFAVEQTTADVSLVNLATGHIDPKKVDLRGANLTLHVSADGKVLTTLPKTPAGGGGGALPAITVTDGRLTIRQDGRPEFALQNLNLSVEPAGDRVKLAGTVDDPLWSKWTLTGDVAREGKTGSVELAAADAPLTMDRLGSIPFVPPSVWRHVRPDGRGAVSVRLWVDSAGEPRYAAEVKPNAAALTLPDADVTLQHVTGTATVSASKVTLAGARAELAGGVVTADGECDFGPEPTVAHVVVSADKLDIRKLPAEWKLPKEFEGKLKGKADLTLRVYADGRIEPDGGGEGVITEVKFADIPADDIPIHLRKAGNQYEFRQPKATGRARPARAAVPCSAPAQDKKPTDPPKTDPKKDPAPKGAPTTLDATLRFRDVDVAQLLEKLKVKINYKIAGRVTAEATVTVPVSGVTSQAAYQFVGKFSSPALTLEGLTIRDLSAHMTYQNGTFTLTDLSGKIDQPGAAGQPPGTFRGTLTAVRSPPGDVSADLTIDRIPVGEVLKALPGFALDVRGTVAGKVSMKAPYATIEDPAGWSGSGDITSSELVVAGRSAKDVRFSATVAKGEATVKEARVTLEGIPIRAAATLGLSGKYPFTATVRTTGTDVTDLRKLVPEAELPAPVAGVLETETTVKGTASPLTYAASGSIKATKLTLARSTANHVEAKWELTPERLVVSDLKAEAFSGTLTGSADVPLAADKAGKFGVSFKNLDATAATELVPDFPVKIGGQVSGKIGGTIAPAKPGASRVGNLDVDISSPKLTVQGIPAEKLVGKATIRNAALEYELEGKTLGGSFEIKGRYPGQKKDAAPEPGGPRRGSFRLRGADLSRVATDVGFRSLAPLAGRLDASFDYENDFSAGSGQVRFVGLRWGDAALAEEITGALTLEDGILRLTGLVGRVAGGELRARAQVTLHDTARNFFTLSLAGAEAGQLLAPFAGGAVSIAGPVTFVVRGRLGRETSGSGTLTLTRGTVAGVPVNDLNIPFDFATAPGGHGQLVIREASLGAGSGQARADLTLHWGTETRVDGHVRFTNVPIRTVAPGLGENALVGNGTITGRFDLAGTRVRSADDLTGTLVATLNNTSVREVPILQQITPFMNPAGLAKPFQSGDVRGTLANGLFRVQRLALSNPAAQLFAEGTVATTGRLDLNVVAHTGTIGPESRAMRLLGLRLPAVGPVPLTLIRDVSDFFSNRTIRLTINGTTANPIVRVNVGALLSEEAVRFLLGRYVLPAGAAGALGLGTSLGSNK